jgi:polysaccharide chain length determinant protein (PEP-CTERM system associated)
MEEKVELDIKKYWRIIVGRRHIFIAVALSCISVIVWGSFFLPKIYEAKSTVMIERNIINSLVKNLAIPVTLDERLNVLSNIMTSRQIILKVIDDLDLNVKSGKQTDIENLVQNFQNETKIKMTKSVTKKDSTDWFSVTYKDKNPKLARDFINTLVRRYVEDNLSAKKEESFEANKFLMEQRNFFQAKIDAAEVKILEFRRSRGIFIALDEKAVVGEIKAAEENIEAIGLQRMELQARKNMTEKQLKEEKPYTVAMLGKTKGESLNDRLLSLQNKFNDLLVRYTENYPEVIKVKAEIEILKKQIQASSSPEASSQGMQGSETEMTTLNPFHQKLKEELAKIDLELAALAAKEKHLIAAIVTKKRYLSDIPLDKKNLADLERERDTYKKIEDELVVKLGQSEVSKQMEIEDKTETFRVIDPAILPTKPVSPNRVLIILAGFLGGIAAGFGTVLLLDNFDSSMKTVDQLKKDFRMPVLAVIPQIVTDEEVNKMRKMDRKVYAISLAYLSIIGILFLKEAIAMFL